jgi:hypothetical protein
MRVLALVVCACLAVVPAARAEVQLSIRNGRVTIVAKDATVRQILAEWARVGKTKIVNAVRIPGGPITLELKDVTEQDALDVLLRTLSGYITAPRALLAADVSMYDSIAVMPTVATAAPRTSGPSSGPAPFSPPPAFNANDDEQDNAPVPGPVRPGGAAPQPGRPPIFSTFPAPQTGNPAGNARPMLPVVRPGNVGQPQQNNNPEPLQQPVAPPPAAPSASPGGFVGTSAPGMLPPAASQPGQIVQPQRPPGE